MQWRSNFQSGCGMLKRRYEPIPFYIYDTHCNLGKKVAEKNQILKTLIDYALLAPELRNDAK